MILLLAERIFKILSIYTKFSLPDLEVGGGLELDDPLGPFQPGPFYDSMPLKETKKLQRTSSGKLRSYGMQGLMKGL